MNKQILFLGALTLALMSGCRQGAPSHHHEEEQAGKSANDSSALHGHNHADIVVFDPEKAKAAGVEVCSVTPEQFHGVIHVSGEIMPAPGDETTVVAPVSGVVRIVKGATEGMKAGKGTLLFTISSANLQDGDVSRRAGIAFEAAGKEYKRAKSLVKDKIISEKEFNAIKAEYERARLAYDAIGRGNGGAGVPVAAGAGGYVKNCMVKTGDYVEVGQPMMTLTKNRRLCLRAEVAERHNSSLSAITSAKFKTSYSDRVFDISKLNGRLLSYGKSSAGASSYIPVTFEFDNAASSLPVPLPKSTWLQAAVIT